MGFEERFLLECSERQRWDRTVFTSREASLRLTGDIYNPRRSYFLRGSPMFHKVSTSKQARDVLKNLLAYKKKETMVETQGRCSFIRSVEGHRFLSVAANYQYVIQTLT